MKSLLLSALILMSSSGALAAELTPANLVGFYKVEAKVLFKRIYGNFRVLDTKHFEFQQTYADGKVDETCNGTFTLGASFFLVTDSLLAPGKIFKGTATCPSNRSETMTFDIDFEDTTTEDLVRGTTLKVRTSLGGGVRLNAYVKKQ